MLLSVWCWECLVVYGILSQRPLTVCYTSGLFTGQAAYALSRFFPLLLPHKPCHIESQRIKSTHVNLKTQAYVSKSGHSSWNYNTANNLSPRRGDRARTRIAGIEEATFVDTRRRWCRTPNCMSRGEWWLFPCRYRWGLRKHQTTMYEERPKSKLSLLSFRTVYTARFSYSTADYVNQSWVCQWADFEASLIASRKHRQQEKSISIRIACHNLVTIHSGIVRSPRGTCIILIILTNDCRNGKQRQFQMLVDTYNVSV